MSYSPYHWVTHGPFTGDTQALALDHSMNPPTLYAGTDGGGVFKSTDNGVNWVAQSNKLYGGSEVQALAIDYDDNNTLYAGTEGGVFRWTNRQWNWRMNRWEAGHWTDIGLCPNGAKKADFGEVQALAISPRHVTPYGVQEPTLYVGTEQNGVFYSRDRGESWFQPNTITDNYGKRYYPNTLNVRALAVDPLNPEVVYAGINSYYDAKQDSGVFKSVDNGANWTRLDNWGPEKSDAWPSRP